MCAYMCVHVSLPPPSESPLFSGDPDAEERTSLLLGHLLQCLHKCFLHGRSAPTSSFVTPEIFNSLMPPLVQQVCTTRSYTYTVHVKKNASEDCFQPASAMAPTMGISWQKKLNPDAIPTIFERLEPTGTTICKKCVPLFDKKSFRTFMVCAGRRRHNSWIAALYRTAHCGAAIKVRCFWWEKSGAHAAMFSSAAAARLLHSV